MQPKSEKPQLTIRPDGSFTIAQFTDLHGHGYDNEKDQKTLELIERILEKERPDLAVFTGDIIGSKQCQNPYEAFPRPFEVAERVGIPWTVTLGNHDADRPDTDKMELFRSLSHLRLGFTDPGPDDIHGVGNQVLEIRGRSGELSHAIYLLDSGDRAPESIGGYEWIHSDQIEWYRQQSRRLRKGFNEAIPSLFFFHIPVMEHQTVWEQGTCVGIKNEEVCCPKINSGLFTAMLEEGNVIGAFVGHDHRNDYVGNLYGIHLGYGLKTGYTGYPHEHQPDFSSFRRGARMIRLQEGRSGLETWLHYEDHTTLSHINTLR